MQHAPKKRSKYEKRKTTYNAFKKVQPIHTSQYTNKKQNNIYKLRVNVG